MNVNDILLLVKAGYSRQEIDAMDQAPGADPVPPAADPVPPAADPVPPAADPVPGPAPAVKPSPAPAPAPAPAADASAILSAINGLGAKITAAMQAASLSAAMMRTPPENESVEQVVASIINPKE